MPLFRRDRHFAGRDAAQLLDALPVAALLVASDGEILDANSLAVDVCGRGELGAVSLLDVVHPDDHTVVRSLLTPSMLQTNAAVAGQTPIRRRDASGPARMRLLDGGRRPMPVRALATSVDLGSVGRATLLAITEESAADITADAYALIARGRPVVEAMRQVAAAIAAPPIGGRGAVMWMHRSSALDERRFEVVGDWPLVRRLADAPGSPWRRAVFERHAVDCVGLEDPRLSPELRGAMRAAGFETVLARPIVSSDDEVLAVLVAWRTGTAEVDETVDRQLDALTETLAVAFARAESEQRRHQRPVRDTLTGASSGAALEQRVRSTTACIGALYVDIDHFRNVNEAYGRAFGDDVLRESVRRLARSVRSADTIYRVGGDTFVVVCETSANDDVTPAEAIGDLADRIVHAFDMPVSIGEHLLSIAVSVGASVGRGALDDCVSAAEAALFVAKETGRGRWHLVELPDDGRANTR